MSPRFACARRVFVVFVACLPVMAVGQEATPRIRATRPQSGEVNLEVSRVYVHAKKKGFGHEHAVIGQLASGTLHLERAPHGKLVFDMTSFRADGEQARKFVGLEGATDEATQKQVNENLLGKDVLNVRTYPKAEFEVTAVKILDGAGAGEKKVELTGEFQLHGRRKPVKIEAVVSEVKGWQHLRGSFKILQSDYGIKPYSKAFGAVGVADELTIWGDLFVAP